MSRPLPPLSAVRCFEAVVRHGSFTRAGEALGMTQAAVSYQIKLLEDRTGVSLFVRGPRGVELSPAGQRIAPRVAEAFDVLRAAFEDLADTAAGHLTIDAIQTFAATWLASRLGEFQLAHPTIAVRLVSNSALTDFSRSDVDVAIRSGRGAWPGLVAHPLLPVSFTPLASPRFVAEHALQEPADLLKVPLIDPRDAWWTLWFRDLGVDPGDLSRRAAMNVDTQLMAARAAIGGHGAAILTPPFFRDEIAAGLLMQPFPHVGREGRGYYLVYPEVRRHAPAIRAFRDWLLAALAADPIGGGI